MLLSRVLLALELNLYIPISKLEENMRQAHRMNAVTEAKFWFRKWLLPYEICQDVKSRFQAKKTEVARKTAGAAAAASSQVTPDIDAEAQNTPDSRQSYTGPIANGTNGNPNPINLNGKTPPRTDFMDNNFLHATDDCGCGGPSGFDTIQTDLYPNYDEPGRTGSYDCGGPDYGVASDDQFELMTIKEILLGKECSPMSPNQWVTSPSMHGSTGATATAASVNGGGSASAINPSGAVEQFEMRFENVDTNGDQSSRANQQAGGSSGSTASAASPNNPNRFSTHSTKSDVFTSNKFANARACYFPGLIALCRTYLEFVGVDSVTADKLNMYMDFIALRAAGKVQTNAQFIRNFIRKHPSYKRDSRVPKEAAYDMVMKAKRIGEGLEPCPEVLGPYSVPPCRPACNPFKTIEEGFDL